VLDGGTTQDAFDDCICHCNLVAHSHSYQRIHAAYYASNRELAPCGFSDTTFGLPEGSLAERQRCTVSQINKSIKTAKAIFTYAYGSKYVTTNIMHRYPKVPTHPEESCATNKGCPAIGADRQRQPELLESLFRYAYPRCRRSPGRASPSESYPERSH
jgi:hypothetical protein